jgi:ribonuclease HI
LKVDIYTDGAARGNPGPGGYGVVMISGKHRKELSQGYRHTTNNRMELLAVIVALEQLKVPGMDVTITTDSKYVCEAVEKRWVFGWQARGFSGKKNADLWKRFLALYPTQRIKFKWVKGHAGHRENERCDVLATAAADGKDLLTDEGYEQPGKPSGALL